VFVRNRLLPLGASNVQGLREGVVPNVKRSHEEQIVCVMALEVQEAMQWPKPMPRVRRQPQRFRTGDQAPAAEVWVTVLVPTTVGTDDGDSDEEVDDSDSGSGSGSGSASSAVSNGGAGDMAVGDGANTELSLLCESEDEIGDGVYRYCIVCIAWRLFSCNAHLCFPQRTRHCLATLSQPP